MELDFLSRFEAWGGRTSDGVGVFKILEGFLNATAYKEIITDDLLPIVEVLSEYTSNVIFQDDFAP